MILKNIKPYLASQLNTVDELVKLGFQLEKDHAQQLHYEGRITNQPTSPQILTSNRPTENPPAQCWRCKGHHPPGNCLLYSTLLSTQHSSNQHPSMGSKRSFHPQKSGDSPSNNTMSVTIPSESNPKSETFHSTASNKFVSIPQQLVVPINIGGWKGKVIVDTGASYTLLHDSLWKELNPHDHLHPWSTGPLFLASGDAEVPLGWKNTQIILHDQVFTSCHSHLQRPGLLCSLRLGLHLFHWPAYKCSRQETFI